VRYIIALQTSLSPPRHFMPQRQSQIRETLRAVFDVVMLAEPAQTALWHSQSLTLTQLGAIRALAGGPLPAGLLAERLATSPTSLTRVLDRLEARGLLARGKDDRDRRKVTIHLLPAGSRLLDGISVLAGTAMHDAVTTMTDPDRDQLLASATLLAEMTRQSSANALVAKSVEREAQGTVR
jgi:DNA-binding MarR family transcriptional regulator